MRASGGGVPASAGRTVTRTATAATATTAAAVRTIRRTARRRRAPPNSTFRESRAMPPRTAVVARAREGRMTPRRLSAGEAASASGPLPFRSALVGERAHALEEVVGGEAGLPQRDQLALGLAVERALGGQQLADHALVAGQRERRVGRDLRRELDAAAGQLVATDDLVHQAPRERGLRVDVAPDVEQLARA